MTWNEEERKDRAKPLFEADEKENQELRKLAQEYFKKHGTYEGFFNKPKKIEATQQSIDKAMKFKRNQPSAIDRLKGFLKGK